MGKTFSTLTITFSALTFCNAQKIETQMVSGDDEYVQNRNPLKMEDLGKNMESNQQAFDLIKKAQSNLSLASVIGLSGGGLLGWPAGTALGFAE